MTEPARRWVRLDTYGIDDIAKEFVLRPNDVLTLLTVARLAHWETHEWTGTLGDLAASTRLGKNTVPGSAQRLVDKNLLGVAQQFVAGGQGTLGVIVYDRLVVPTPRQSKRERVDVSRWSCGPVTVISRSSPRPLPTQSLNGERTSLEVNGSEPSRGARNEERGVGCAAHGIESCLDCPPDDELAPKNSAAAITNSTARDADAIREMLVTSFSAEEVCRDA